jgi:dipeptidyl-peptidase-4
MRSWLNRNYALITLLVIICAGPARLYARDYREITLEDIYRSMVFTPETLEGLNSMNDGEHYTVLSFDRIEKYSYCDGHRVETLFDASGYENAAGFDAYQFICDEKKIMIETGHEKIYRHSYRANYLVYNRSDGSLVPLSAGGKQQLGTFSPTGEYAAFVRDNNLFIKDLKKNTEIQITFDGAKNEVINGAPDWVYEEEFAFSQAYCWSPDGTKIAFYRFDESRVKEFQMMLYGPLYPVPYRFKYPKAGEENSVVSIRVYDLETGKTRIMDTGEETDQYIPRIKWTSDPEVLSILRLNRLQNVLEVLHVQAATGTSSVVYREENPRYISEVSDQTLTYVDDGAHFILNSEREGFFHFYLYNFKTGEINPITSGDYDVDELLGYDTKGGLLYYTSHEESPLETHVYSIRLDGTGKKKMSKEPGTSTATFSTTFKYFILNHSSANSPERISLHDRKGREIRVLVDNDRLKAAMKEHGFARTEFLTVPTASGQVLNAWMIKPADFDPSRVYPLFIYVYGGPQSQNVVDNWGSRTPWFQMLVQKGYIVACVDNRGTDGRGEEFRKATYLNLGQLETIDQLEAARWFGSLDYIDEDRMGIFGWSYGGFMTSLCMTKGQGTFRMGIAVAPVTNWRYYDTVYTERFMRTPAENPGGYDHNSPVHYAASLQGKFLLIHGSADDNVHFQNSMDLTEALVQSGKQFEMQVYPNKDHGISGGDTSYHLYKRMTDYILGNL